MNIDDAETLCRQLAPADLATTPVYVLAGDTVPERLRAGDCLGYSHAATDLWAWPELEAAGRWQGRGVALVSMLPAWHPCFEMVVIHELAHALERPRRTGTVETLERDEFPEHAAALAIGPAQVETVKQEGLAPWHGHGATWHRVLIHLAYRLSLLRGRTITAGSFAAGRPYGLSPALKYQQALGDEPELYLDGKLAELCNCEPPEEYRQLWQADTNEPWTFGT